MGMFSVIHVALTVACSVCLCVVPFMEAKKKKKLAGAVVFVC